jgi:hypothetical protein
MFKDERDDGRGEKRSAQRVNSQPPAFLSLPGAGEDAQHEEDDVKRRGDVGDLETKVPQCPAACPDAPR